MDDGFGDRVVNVKTETDFFRLNGRPCELSAYSFIPAQRKTPKERTVFNSVAASLVSQPADENTHRTYDRLYGVQELGYNAKLHRDDREHAKSRGLDVHSEEVTKDVPSLASTEYGHRLDKFLDPPSRKYVRIALVKAEFFRRNGITS